MQSVDNEIIILSVDVNGNMLSVAVDNNDVIMSA